MYGDVGGLVNKSRFFPEFEYIVYVPPPPQHSNGNKSKFGFNSKAKTLPHMWWRLQGQLHALLPVLLSRTHAPLTHYVSYDSSGAFIEPHVDNHSVITGIVMLAGKGVCGFMLAFSLGIRDFFFMKFRRSSHISL